MNVTKKRDINELCVRKCMQGGMQCGQAFVWRDPNTVLNSGNVKKTNLMQYLSLIYLVTYPLHVSGICCPSSGGIHCIYTTIGT
jgi:hypothetical protein